MYSEVMYNFDDANNYICHHITEGQYVACTWTKPAILVTNLIVILLWGNKGGEGEGEVEIIHMCIYMYTRVYASV